MNKAFSEHVRSGTFTLTLSQRMICALLTLNKSCNRDLKLILAPYQALERRGLAEYEKGGRGYKITTEGKHVAEMLLLAGY